MNLPTIKEGMKIRLLELPIIIKLTKNKAELPILSTVMFDSDESYYKHVRFNVPIQIFNYRFRPAFYFSNFTDVCHEIRTQHGKTVCYTENLIIDWEDAVRTKEIKIVENDKPFLSDEDRIDIQSLKNEMIDIDQYYQQGLVTVEDMNSKITSLHNYFCFKQKKWNAIVKQHFFKGGLASERSKQ